MKGISLADVLQRQRGTIGCGTATGVLLAVQVFAA